LTGTVRIPIRRNGNGTGRIVEHLAHVVTELRARELVAAARADHDQVGTSPGGEFVEAAAERRRLDPRHLGGDLRLVPQPLETL
jgi:hypothetical protein